MLHHLAHHLHQGSAALLATLLYQPWLTSATLACGLVAYYCIKVVKVPELISAPSCAWRSFLLEHVPILRQRYWCSLWCYEARAHTVAASLLNSRVPPLRYNREIIQLSDGGQLCLDWIIDEKSASTSCDSQQSSNPSREKRSSSCDNATSNLRNNCEPKSNRSTAVTGSRGDQSQLSSQVDDVVDQSQSSSQVNGVFDQLQSSSQVDDQSARSDTYLNVSGKNHDRSMSSGGGYDSGLCSDQSSSHVAEWRSTMNNSSQPQQPNSHSGQLNGDSILDTRSKDCSSSSSTSLSSADSVHRSSTDQQRTTTSNDNISNANVTNGRNLRNFDESLDADATYPISNKPILIVLPGLTGSSESEYVKEFVGAGHRAGFKCVVFNNRGKGGVILKTPRTYCAGNCDDLAEAIEQIVARYRREQQQSRNSRSGEDKRDRLGEDGGNLQVGGHLQDGGNLQNGGVGSMTNSGNCRSNDGRSNAALINDRGEEQRQEEEEEGPVMAAVGISLGGMILCHYLSSRSQVAARRLRVAVGVSVPYNVFVGTASLERPWLNLALNKHLAGCLVASVVELKDVLQHSDHWDYDHVLEAKTIRQFDSRFTAMQFGFPDVNTYYNSATLHDKMDGVRVPYLGLSAEDDPFQPREGLPIYSAERSQHFALAVTARGGHIGFLEGLSAQCWGARLIEQVLVAVLDNREAVERIKIGGR